MYFIIVFDEQMINNGGDRAEIPPLVNAASRRELEVSSSGRNRFQTRKFFRDAPLIELFNGNNSTRLIHGEGERHAMRKKKKKEKKMNSF